MTLPYLKLEYLAILCFFDKLRLSPPFVTCVIEDFSRILVSRFLLGKKSSIFAKYVGL